MQEVQQPIKLEDLPPLFKAPLDGLDKNPDL